MPLKIYFASAEINYRCIKDTPTENWLVSFFYLRRMPKDRLRHFLDDAKHGLKRLGIDKERSLFLDSGAFSFQNAFGCIPGRTNQDTTELNSYALLKYTLDYLDFIKEWGHYFDIIVEVDVDYILGVKKTRYLFERLRSEGHDVRPVWHIPRGEARWIEECREFDYHGIEGQTRHKDDPISFYNQMLKISHEQKTYSKVHGFAMTSLDLLYKVPFDSVDSASWMLQAANGTVKTPFGTIAISSRQLIEAEIGDSLNYATMNEMNKKQFEHYANDRGFTIDELKSEWKARAALNTYYYVWMEKEINRHWEKQNAKKVFQKALFSV